MWRFSISLFAVLALISHATDSWAQRIPSLPDDYGRSSAERINSGNRIPSIPRTSGIDRSGPGTSGNRTSSSGAKSFGSGNGGSGISGLPDTFEFRCSSCNRVIATGTSEASAANISSCKFCGVRFSNTAAGRNNAAVNRSTTRPSSATTTEKTRTASSRKSKDEVPVALLYFVIGVTAAGATMIAIGGIVFMIVKEATKRRPTYGPYGNSPPTGNSSYSQPPINNPPWNRR